MSDEWTQCANLRDLATAQVVRSRLEAAGIPVMMPDENMAGVAWHLGQAIGGVRLFVPPSQLAEATGLIHEDAAPQKGPPELPTLSPGDQLAHRAFKAAVVGTLLFIVLPYAVQLVFRALSKGDLTTYGRRRVAAALVVCLFALGVLFLIVAIAPIAIPGLWLPF